MASELDRISKMLEADTAELQCAAARVLGELKPKDAAVRKALLKALKSTHDSLRLYAAEALAAIDPKGTLPQIVPLLSGPGEARQRISSLLIEHGKEAAKALRDHLGKADAAGRKAILEVMSQLPDVDATETLFAGLLDSDLDVVRKTAQAYRQRISSMPDDERPKALKKVLQFLDSPRVKKSRTPIASTLLIAGTFRDGSAVKPVLPFVDKKMPPAIRNAALLALGSLPIEGPAAKAVPAKLLPLLGESDLNNIVRPALDVLRKIPLEKSELDRVLKLQKSGFPPVRQYAVRAIGSIGGAKASGTLIDALMGDDPSLSDTASHALRTHADYVPAIVKALGKEKDPQRVWKLGHILQNYRNVLDKPTVKKFVSTSLEMLGKKQSGFQVYFEIARAASPDALRDAFLKRGRELLAKKKSDDAERHLRLLARDDLATPESDFVLALAQLQTQRKDLGQAGRDRGPSLTLFAKLIRGGFPVGKQLQKEAKFLSSSDLLYLGFALVERQGTERDAGADVLKFVARKFGSKEDGKVAKQKLKTQGMG